MHAGEQVGVDDIGGGRAGDRLLVRLGRVGLLRGDEARADVGKVGAHRLRGQHCLAGGDRARQRDRAVEDLAHLAHQRERRQHAGMAAGARRDQDQAVDAGFDRLLGMAQADHVMQHDAAIAVHRVDQLPGRRAQRGDEDRHLVFDADLDVMLQARVGGVHDLVDRDRAHRCAGIGGLERGQFVADPGQPLVEQLGRACIECGERADDAGLALRQHQFRVADDEHGRGNHGQGQVLQGLGQLLGGGHGVSWTTGGHVVVP